MRESNEEITKIVRLKRYETPPEGYFDDFVNEFQRRQRSELLNCSARGIFCERVATYMSDFGRPFWVMGAGAAAAVVATVFFLQPATSGGDGVVEHSTLNPATASGVLWGGDVELPRQPGADQVLPPWNESEMSVGPLIPVSAEGEGGFLFPAVQ